MGKERNIKRVVFVFAVLAVLVPAYSQSVKEVEVRAAFGSWSKKSPHFNRGKTPFVRETYRIKELEKLTLESGALPFYAIELEPEGFVIMNSDKRLPTVIAYSDTGSLNLEDMPQNTFRFLLKRSMERNRRKLLRIFASGSLMDSVLASSGEAENTVEWKQLIEEDPIVAEDPVLVAGMGGVTNGPFLTTTWNQNNHYNELCPEDSGASDYYDGRVPVGCVAAAGAQIMNFYEWPWRGSGGHSYTDNEGSITGEHSVVFSDSYDWANMQDSYYAWGSEPQAAVDAVSEIMYETGVAVEMNYESAGSSSSTAKLNTMMDTAFLYEEGVFLYNSTGPQAIADQIRADMLAGRPACVSVPGHAVVADGHVDDGANEYFHINYGWGGNNDGWYLIDSIVDDPAVECISGLYPDLVPLNVTESGTTNMSSAVSLQWTLADVRTADVQSISVLEYVLNNSIFTDPAEDFSNFEITSTSDYKDWAVTNTGYSGDCFFKAPGGYSIREYHLTSIEKFVPAGGTDLSFRLKARLSSDMFNVMVSDDDGQSWVEEYSLTDFYNGTLSWQLVTVDLSAYAGSEVDIRFEYVVGGYYSSGGVWLDSIGFSGGGWYGWETRQSFASVSGGTVTNLPEGTNTLALQAYDGSAYGELSPSFTVVVQPDGNDEDGDGLPDGWEEQYYGGTTNANPAAIAANGVNTVMEAYIAGLNPTNAASFFTASLTNQNGFVVQWSAASGRVYSVVGTTNLQESFQPLETGILWPQSSWTDTVDRTERFYKVDVQLAK